MALLKLSNAQYQLPIIEALVPEKTFESGTTKPFGILGIDASSGEKGQYVVKCRNAGRMSPTSSAFELIAAWMAMELNLPVAEPCLVHLSQTFVENAMPGHPSYVDAQKSIGMNVGSKYQAGYAAIPYQEMNFNNELYNTIKLLYTFDVFISNTDRGHQKPNVLTNGKKLFIFDHELAFSFVLLLPFSRNKEPWILKEIEREIYSKHFFYRYLKKRQPDLSPEVQLLKQFDQTFWEQVNKHLPEEWKSEKTEEISTYLCQIVKNLDYFAESLNQTLLQ